MGVKRTALTLLRVNQKDGFDCPGCAWPEPEHRHTAEFCENGAKAVAEEATLRRVTPEFFAAHPVADLADQQRLLAGPAGAAHPPHVPPRGRRRTTSRSPGSAPSTSSPRSSPPSPPPTRPLFYTSGRTSNEAAFLYQLFARELGTNNLPDCSNMCHESSGSALSETIGIGKGSVLLDDLYKADLIIVAGQNPGTNHPRMLSALEKAKANGAKIISVNPLPEAGLERFKNPQTPQGMLKGAALTDLFLQIRIGGDQALFRLLNKLILETEGAVDEAFVARTHPRLRGVRRGRPRRRLGRDAHRDRPHARGDRGSPAHGPRLGAHHRLLGDGPHPAQALRADHPRGRQLPPPARQHRPPRRRACARSAATRNVQGDRTMGIFERPAPAFLDALEKEFGFAPPREHGYDVVRAIRALRDGEAKVFFAMGGNFVSASPDTDVTEAAMRRARLTVHVSTKLNRSHAVTGARALILPTLGRTERDLQGSGEQFVTVEDSMGMVHASRGRLEPASAHLLSEPAIVCRLARRVLGDDQPHALGGVREGLRHRSATASRA